MFQDFSEVWSPVLPAADLPADRPVGLKVAGVPVALFRDAQGRPAAVIDRCPHRGVALSLGKVEDGCLVCPFHGWTFDEKGRNCRVPWNPDARLERLGASPLPARELAGQIWIFTGPEAPGEPEVDEIFLREGIRVSGMVEEIQTHWTRVMENMLDWPHLPFVHQRTIGKGLVSQARGRMDVHLDIEPWGFRSHVTLDGAPSEGSMNFRFPNMMNLFIGIPGRTLVMMVACVPVDEARTRLVMMTARSFARLGILDAVFNWQNRKIFREDLEVVESSPPGPVPHPREERSVRTDAPTLHFRKRYLAELAPGRGEGGMSHQLDAHPDAPALLAQGVGGEGLV